MTARAAAPDGEEGRAWDQLPQGAAVEPGFRHRCRARGQAVRESIRVPARIEARPDGAADVVAPIDGRLRSVANVPLGATVTRDRNWRGCCRRHASQPTCRNCSARKRRRRPALALATRDRERAERLTSAGAAPAKRLDEARAAEEQAQGAADRRRGQPRAVQRRARRRRVGRARAVHRPCADSPASSRSATPRPAPTSRAGTRAVPIVDAAQVHVVGQVPEARSGARRAATARRNGSAGRPDACAAGRLVSVGKVLESAVAHAADHVRARQPPLGLPGGPDGIPASAARRRPRRGPSCPPRRSWTMRAGRSCSCSAKARRSSGAR